MLAEPCSPEGPDVLRIHPFHALRPAGSRAALVSCGPSREGCACGAPTPDSFRQVAEAASEIEVRRAVERLVASGALCCEAEQHVFLYRIARDGRRQLGIVAVVDRGDLEPATEATELIPAWAEPAIAIYDDPDAIIASLAVLDTNERPIFHFNAGDGTTHSAWLVRDASAYCDAFARLSGKARLVEPGPSAGQGRMLALLVERASALEPIPAPRCGLFVPRSVLVP
jgi:hypothetical protein